MKLMKYWGNNNALKIQHFSKNPSVSSMKKTNQTSNTAKRQTNQFFFLILSCSGGAGHIRAAEALHKTAQLTGLPIRTEHYDVLDLSTMMYSILLRNSLNDYIPDHIFKW